MKIEKRTESLAVVRGANKVAGVIFGKTITPISIQVEDKELKDTLKTYGMTQVFKVKLGKATHQVYVKDLQKDVLNPSKILNVKLLKVSADDTIKANVPLNIIGRENVEKPGVLLSILADQIEVEYGVGKGVSSIDVDISEMKIGDSLSVKDLTLPEGLHSLEDEEKTIITVSEVQMIAEEDELEEPENVDPMDVEVLKQGDE